MGVAEEVLPSNQYNRLAACQELAAMSEVSSIIEDELGRRKKPKGAVIFTGKCSAQYVTMHDP